MVRRLRLALLLLELLLHLLLLLGLRRLQREVGKTVGVTARNKKERVSMTCLQRSKT